MKNCLRRARALITLLAVLLTTGCAGAVIDAAADSAIALAKVPFKVGGAVVDVASGDDD